MSLFDQLGAAKGDQMQQLRNNPVGMAKQAGYQIPENLSGDPRAMVMHLIQTGQVGGPMLQRIMPMIQKMGGK